MNPLDGKVLHSAYENRTVRRYSDDKIKKRGPMLRPFEAETMKFIAENTTIPVPKVYDTDWQDGNMTTIIMEYVPGKTLDKIWGKLNKEQKESICLELKGYVAQLRNLTGTYIGGLNRGKAVIGKTSPHECGPFATELQFNVYLLEDVKMETPDMVRTYAKHALSHHHRIVFTHGGITPSNIIINEKLKIAAILDWEESGWYPEHWEYIKAFHDLEPMVDWPEFLPLVFPPKYEKEYIGMCFLETMMYH